MVVSHRSLEEIRASTTRYTANEDAENLLIAQIEEWMLSGAACVPQKRAEEQREKFFPEMSFSNLEALLAKSEKEFV